MARRHFDNYDYAEDSEQYLAELEAINEALEKVKTKIKTWHGKIVYDEQKHTIENLVELNKSSKKGGWYV
jgi:ribonuclease HI